MFRALFGRSRTVRIPVDKSTPDIQTVRLSARTSKNPIQQFILAGIIAAVAAQGIRSLDPSATHGDVGSSQKRRGSLYNEEGLDRKGDRSDERQRIQGNERSRVTSASTGIASMPDTICLTIPIWIRRGLQLPYSPDSSEYKDFARLQGDAKRMSDIKRQVTRSVIRGISNNPITKTEFRIIDFKGTVMQHLTIVPQLAAPPQYQVPCVWLSLKNITASVGWRPLTADVGARIERVFRPWVLLDASTAAARVFWNTSYAITKARIKERFGSETSNGFKNQISIPEAALAVKEDQKRDNDGTRTANTGKYGLSSSIPVLPYLPDVSDGETTRKMHQSVVSVMPYSTAITQAVAMFERVKMARQKAAVSNNVRGLCQVRGMLVCMGTRGALCIELVAYYLPGENVFLGGIQVRDRYLMPDYHAFQQEYDAKKLKWEQNAAEAKQGRKSSRASSNTSPSSGGSTTSAETDDKKKEK